MQKALESLPWVRKAELKKNVATLTVEREGYDAKMVVEALKKAGFGGKLASEEAKKQEKNEPPDATSLVTFRVIGMKKTKSGAT